MAIRVYIDGVIHAAETALVPVFDRGFLYGDSVYEVTRTAGGRPVDLDLHLERLERSSQGILLPLFKREKVARAVRETLIAAENRESYVRIMVTRGAGEIGLDPALADEPRLIVIVRPLRLPDPKLYAEGAEVALVAVRRNLRRAVDPAVKSGNYLNNIMALAEAKRAGAYESIMCNAEGRVVEDGLLDGITRYRVVELAAALGRAVEEAHLMPEDLKQADEAFLTSSVRGVMPVVRASGEPIGSGTPGPVTRDLMDLYARFLSRVAAGEV
jgi:branched-chain amino acid aminotransferase